MGADDHKVDGRIKERPNQIRKIVVELVCRDAAAWLGIAASSSGKRVTRRSTASLLPLCAHHRPAKTSCNVSEPNIIGNEAKSGCSGTLGGCQVQRVEAPGFGDFSKVSGQAARDGIKVNDQHPAPINLKSRSRGLYRSWLQAQT